MHITHSATTTKSPKLQAYLEKEKAHPLYAYKFQPISTAYERVGMGSFAETLHPASLYDLIEFALRECIKREQRMRICSYCGKYFAIPHRNTAEFCTLTVDENGHTCKEVGAIKRWAEKKTRMSCSRSTAGNTKSDSTG